MFQSTIIDTVTFTADKKYEKGVLIAFGDLVGAPYSETEEDKIFALQIRGEFEAPVVKQGLNFKKGAKVYLFTKDDENTNVVYASPNDTESGYTLKGAGYATEAVTDTLEGYEVAVALVQ